LLFRQNFQYNNPGSTGITEIAKLEIRDKSFIQHKQEVPEQEREKTKQNKKILPLVQRRNVITVGLAKEWTKPRQKIFLTLETGHKTLCNHFVDGCQVNFSHPAISKDQKEREQQPTSSQYLDLLRQEALF